MWVQRILVCAPSYLTLASYIWLSAELSLLVLGIFVFQSKNSALDCVCTAVCKLILSCSSFSIVLDRILWKKIHRLILRHLDKSIQWAKAHAADLLLKVSISQVAPDLKQALPVLRYSKKEERLLSKLKLGSELGSKISCPQDCSNLQWECELRQFDMSKAHKGGAVMLRESQGT